MNPAHIPTVAFLAEVLFDLLKPLLVPTIMAVGWFVVAEMKRRGYQITYAAALVRAVGAGFSEAQRRGLDPFGIEGRQVVIAEGTHYLETTVADSATALGITPDDHAMRITAQLGVMQVQAQVHPLALK